MQKEQRIRPLKRKWGEISKEPYVLAQAKKAEIRTMIQTIRNESVLTRIQKQYIWNEHIKRN